MIGSDSEYFQRHVFPYFVRKTYKKLFSMLIFAFSKFPSGTMNNRMNYRTMNRIIEQ